MGINLALKFKGARNYLHGSDLFFALSAWATQVFGDGSMVSRLAFRNFARHQCRIELTKPEAPTSAFGEGSVTVNGEMVPFWLVEGDLVVEDRYPFDEDGLVSGAEVDNGNRTASLAFTDGFTTIEQVIALTKKLNYEVAPNIEGKWVFGQLQLSERLPTSYQYLTIRMSQMLANRFSVNEIQIDGRQLGNIRFIVGRP